MIIYMKVTLDLYKQDKNLFAFIATGEQKTTQEGIPYLLIKDKEEIPEEE